MACNNYIVGADGPLGKKIKDIILMSNTFIVYMDSDEDIIWHTEDYHDYHENFGEIQNRISEWEAISNDLFSKKRSYPIKTLLAEGYCRILDEKNVDHARDVINRAIQQIEKRGTEVLKQAYAVTSFVCTLFVIAAIFFLRIFKTEIVQYLGVPEYNMLLTALFGGLGSFIFTILRLRQYKPEIVISKNIHRLDGALRIFYGIIAGLLIVLAIHSNIVFGFIDELPDKKSIAFFLAMIAGASEAFIPSLIRLIENKTAEK